MGGHLPKGLAEAALERGIDVFGGYGMSESCPILTLAQLSPAMLEADRVRQLDSRVKAGWPVPLVDLRIVDDAMRDLPHDEQASGEVVVRAPWLTQGYLGDLTVRGVMGLTVGRRRPAAGSSRAALAETGAAGPGSPV